MLIVVGSVNAQDASLILQFVTNVIDSLPCDSNMNGLSPDQLQVMIDMMDEQLSINYTGGSYGGFDFFFPDGFSNDIVYVMNDNIYNVPEGKSLYITIIDGSYCIYGNDEVEYCFDDYFLVDDEQTVAPIIVPGGTTIHKYSPNWTSHFIGFLVDTQTEIILTNTEYSVPEDKILCLINGGQIRLQNENYLYSLTQQNAMLSKGVMFKPSSVLTKPGFDDTDPEILINGYLVDENYFLDSNTNQSDFNPSINGPNFYSNNTSSEIFIWTANNTNIDESSYFIIPSGKQIRILDIDEGYQNANINNFSIFRNGIEYDIDLNYLAYNPVRLIEGDSVVTSPLVGNYQYYSPSEPYPDLTLFGYSYDIIDQIEPTIIKMDSTNQNFTVPSGKKLIAEGCMSTALNGMNISFPNGENYNSIYGEIPNYFPILNSGTVISPIFDFSNPSSEFIITGYYVNQ